MLYIHPEERIDCGACVQTCPVAPQPALMAIPPAER